MSVASRPIIGITSGEIYNQLEPWSSVMFGQSRTYVDSIMAAGGVPLLLPLTHDQSILQILYKLVDGLCFSGGNDIHAETYGQASRLSKNDYSQLRDATEVSLMKWALSDGKPILGICRGMQMLNVSLGGTLHQHIPSDIAGALDHTSSVKLQTLVDLSHTLRIAPKSKLAHVIGATAIGANARHHQAVDVLGKGVIATAWASDGVIEAIELQGHPYAIGIQAHPESLTHHEPRWKALFTSFTAAAAR